MKKSSVLCLLALFFVALALPLKVEAHDGSFSPNFHSYGDRPINFIDLNQTFTFTRLASGTPGNLQVFGVTLTNQVDYKIVDDQCSQTIMTIDGNACTVTVAFNPAHIGTRNATLRLVTDASNGPNFSAALTGNGVEFAQAGANPIEVQFGSVAVGLTSPAVSVLLTNYGTTGLQMTTPPQVTGNSDFTIFAQTCAGLSLIPPNGSCIVQLQFSPSVTGSVTPGSLDFETNGGNISVPLTGQGVNGAAFAPYPASLDFSFINVGETSAARIVEVHNTGLTTLDEVSVGDLVVGNQFEILQDNCDGVSLAPGESCLIQLVFAPTLTGLGIVDSFEISADALPVQSVQLNGNGAAGPALTIQPTALDFGPQAIGTSSNALLLEVRGSGETAANDIIVGALASGVNFEVVLDTCSGLDLGVGQICLIMVEFSPTVTGALADSFTVTATGVGASVVNLAGEGTEGPVSPSPAALAFEPNILDFDNTPLNGSLSQSTFLRNIGTEPVTVSGLGLSGNDTSAFSQSSDCGGLTLEPGDFCMVEVSFAPVTATNYNAILVAESDLDGPPPYVALLGSHQVEATGGTGGPGGNGGNGGCSLQPAGPVGGIGILGIGLTALAMLLAGRRKAARPPIL